MSGTSLDAIDAAWVEFSVAGKPKILDFESSALSEELRAALFALQSASFNDLHQAQLLAIRHADETAVVVAQLLERQRTRLASLRAVAVHGQTVRHQPKLGYTIQLLAGAYLAEKVGFDVIGDFRSADIACGGEGAPLVPAFHQAVFAAGEPQAVVNLGGIANISILVPDQEPLGYDTGPGNLLMDAWIARHLAKPYDANGVWASGGLVHPALLNALKADPYFSLPAPKSTGRDWFHLAWLESKLQALGGFISAVDVQRTLLELTVWSVGKAAVDAKVSRLWLCGGGANNEFLLDVLRQTIKMPMGSTQDLDIHPQQVEACAFAWLGYCFLNRAKANIPAVTGARKAKILGALWPAS